MTSVFPLSEMYKLNTTILSPEVIKTLEVQSGLRPGPSSLNPTLLPSSNQQSALSTNSLSEDRKTKGNSKRNQVPRACTNCRKMHAACGIERPCKRCIQNGLEDCQDIPRKKRITRKKQKNETEEETQSTAPPTSTFVSNSTPCVPTPELQSITTPKFEAPQIRMWEETYADLFGGSKDQQFSPFLNPGLYPTLKKQEKPHNFGFQPESLILSEYSDEEKRIPLPLQPLPSLSGSTQMSPFVHKSWQKPDNSLPKQPALSSNDVNFLLQQISELKESNAQLEKKLTQVTTELNDMRKSNSHKNTSWVPLFSQSELAVSVWKSVTTSSHGTQNVLVECNDRFVDLIGYPIEVLKSNFPCSKMIRRKDLMGEDENGKLEFPKRTQIMTAKGMKEVFIVIYPVLDTESVIRYYVVHLMDPYKK